MAEITWETTSKKKHKAELVKCPKCKGQDLRFYDCGYSAFNYCGIKCMSCKHDVSRMGDYKPGEMAKIWNRLCKPRKTKQETIDILREQIKRLGKEPDA